MLNQEEYNAFKARLESVENSEFRRKYNDNCKLEFHIRRIEDYVKYHNAPNPPALIELMELDYSVSLREVMKLMDKQGWN